MPTLEQLQITSFRIDSCHYAIFTLAGGAAIAYNLHPSTRKYILWLTGESVGVDLDFNTCYIPSKAFHFEISREVLQAFLDLSAQV